MSAAGAVSSLERDGLLAWFTEPQEPVPGQNVKLFYNAQTGPLSHMSPLPSPPTVVLGYNGWLDTKVGRADGLTILLSCTFASWHSCREISRLHTVMRILTWVLGI